MKNSLVLFLLLGVIGLTSAQALAQPVGNAEKVDELFAPWNRKDSPGCVVLVRQDGKNAPRAPYA